jgi:hypothetical protein
MASGKRMEDESFEEYRLRLWCEEKAYRLYRQRRFGSMSYNGYVDKIMDMFNNTQEDSE